MSNLEASPSEDPVDRVSALLEQLLEADGDHQPIRLEELCALHPECAASLRQGYACLREFELLQVGDGAAGDSAAPPATALPRALGPFRLLEFLGAGGMGTVYRAEDTELKRDVALKLVRGELLASTRTRLRFQRESEALARLDHPGLCTVYRAGSTDGQPWIAMRLVRGTSLAEQIEARAKANAGNGGRRSSSHSRDELHGVLLTFEKIARALATAHAAGVVHRDIKPANIVLTAGDEPVVIDFGLVHLEDSGSHLTLSGDHIGTPAYMAPEQVEAAGHEPGPATDVYALGVTLFEVLTSTLPFTASSRESLFHAIVRGERRRLRQVGRGLPADLEIVLEKALDVEPARRYASMVEFADDLRRVRLHEPPAARRIGPILRLRRWCQRNPVAATFLALLSLGLGTALLLDASRQRAQQRFLARSYAQLGGQLLEENPLHGLDLVLRGHDHAPGDPETLGLMLSALQEVHPHGMTPLPWPRTPRVETDALVVSPDGHAALVLGHHSDQTVCAPVLWRDGEAKVLDIPGGTVDAQWSEDGKQFLTTGNVSPPQLWSLAGDLPETLPMPATGKPFAVLRIRFLPGSGGQRILFGCNDGTARILDRAAGRWYDLQPAIGAVSAIAVSADGERIAVGGPKGRIILHQTAAAMKQEPGREIAGVGALLIGLQLSNDGELLQVRQLNPYRCTIFSWSGDELDTWGTAANPATFAPLDVSHNRVLQLVQDSAPRLWQLDHGKLVLVHELAGHAGKIASGSFAPDGHILTTGVDGTARVWNADTGFCEHVLRGFDHELRCGEFLGGQGAVLIAQLGALDRFDLRPAEGQRLRVGNYRDLEVFFPGPNWPGPVLTADDRRRISVHDAEGLPARKPVVEPGYQRRSGIDLAPDSRWLATTNESRKRLTMARIYAPDLEMVQQIDDLQMAEPIPIWGPEGQLLLVDSVQDLPGTSILQLPSEPGHWQPAPAEVQQQFAAATSGTEAFAYHAASSTLALAQPGAAVTLYHWTASPPGLQKLGPLLRDMSKAHKIAFSPDGQHLLLACRDRKVRLVDRAAPERAQREITGHIGAIVDVGFSPTGNGDRLLIAASESGVAIRDRAGNLLLPIRPRPGGGGVTMAAFMPDGERVIYATTARVTRVVPIVPELLVERASAVVRPLRARPFYEPYLQSYRARVGDDKGK